MRLFLHISIVLYSAALPAVTLSCTSSPASAAGFFMQHPIRQSGRPIAHSAGFGVAEAVFQVDKTFPIPLADYDSSILPNNYITFTAYKGQALIYFEIDGIARFTFYINNYKIDTRNLCRKKQAVFDASAYINNGENRLYIAEIRPEPKKNGQNNGKQPQVHIKIPYPVLSKQNTGAPIRGYTKEVFTLIDELITAETEHGFPGVQLLIAKNGTILKNTAYGTIAAIGQDGVPIQNPIPVTTQTLFDLASNTKMYAANFAVQKLLSEKKIHILDTVQSFFPDFISSKQDKIKGKEHITLLHVLTHRSGFAAGGNYYRKLEKQTGTGGKPPRERTLDLILSTPLVCPPGEKIIYSDINYMLLTFIIEKVAGQPLEDYVSESFYRPLGLDRICFKPLEKGFRLNEIAATEYTQKPRLSGRPAGLVHGFVHDEESLYAMEEVSGHAGLFANAESIAVLAQVMLNKGGYGFCRFFDAETASAVTAQQTVPSNIGLGWRRQGIQAYTWAFSPLASEHTFGHTGWTGTLTLIDPQEQLIIVLLTNAKHTPPAKNGRHTFEGDYYLAKKYGGITTLIYEAFTNPKKSRIDSLLIELAEQKQYMLEEIAAFQNDGYRKDAAAIMQVIQKRARRSAALRSFLKHRR